jgi:DNA repair photolyase
MAILRTLNEFTRESVCMAVEPARQCIASCGYCFARLNSMSQHANRSKSLKDDSSFERTLEKAYSPSYDPTNFSQFSLRNRFVLGWANTTEPFQDEQQAISLLKTLDKFSIPIFLQLKGINFIECVSYLEPFKDNSSIFVSLPSLDNRVIKRFEPGTPPIEARLEMIGVLRELGFWVIAALSPWQEEWISDPVDIINTLADRGANQIFVDRLHLNARQYPIAPDRLMASMAGGRAKHWPLRAMEYLRAFYHTALDNELEFFCNGFEGTTHGYYNTTGGTISPDHCFSRGLPWQYHDGRIFSELESIFYSDTEDIIPIDRRPEDSIVVRWSDAISIMQSSGSIDQPFSYSSLMDIVPIYKRIPDSWKKRILGDKHTKGCAPMSDWFRCLWNSPYKHQFAHRHPWMSIASNMDGVPYLDEEGNLICLFDPDFTDRTNRHFRRVESLEPFRELEYGYEDSNPGTNEQTNQ